MSIGGFTSLDWVSLDAAHISRRRERGDCSRLGARQAARDDRLLHGVRRRQSALQRCGQRTDERITRGRRINDIDAWGLHVEHLAIADRNRPGRAKRDDYVLTAPVQFPGGGDGVVH